MGRPKALLDVRMSPRVEPTEELVAGDGASAREVQLSEHFIDEGFSALKLVDALKIGKYSYNLNR